MHDSYHMLFVEVIVSTLLPYVMRPVAVSEANSTSDGIMDHKLMQHRSFTRLVQVVIVPDIWSVIDGGASTAPDHVEPFPNDIPKVHPFSAMYAVLDIAPTSGL
jgi:hypothetical protein